MPRAIADRIAQLQQLIADTARTCQRSPETIQLLAVSKGQPATAIREAYSAGLTNFGESYLQEAQQKMKDLADLAITWHFIGPIQGNKTKGIAQSFSWVHSVDRETLAEKLSNYRSKDLPPLNLCLQVNLDDEPTKSGISPLQLPELVSFVDQLPHLQLRGLMAIPKPLVGEQEQYESLRRLAVLENNINKTLNLGLDTLSMGMSDDLVPAIRAGSTIVRVGRGIFGERGK